MSQTPCWVHAGPPQPPIPASPAAPEAPNPSSSLSPSLQIPPPMSPATPEAPVTFTSPPPLPVPAPPTPVLTHMPEAPTPSTPTNPAATPTGAHCTSLSMTSYQYAQNDQSHVLHRSRVINNLGLSSQTPPVNTFATEGEVDGSWQLDSFQGVILLPSWHQLLLFLSWHQLLLFLSWHQLRALFFLWDQLLLILFWHQLQPPFCLRHQLQALFCLRHQLQVGIAHFTSKKFLSSVLVPLRSFSRGFTCFTVCHFDKPQLRYILPYCIFCSSRMYTTGDHSAAYLHPGPNVSTILFQSLRWTRRHWEFRQPRKQC